jgi:hypothetical protein
MRIYGGYKYKSRPAGDVSKFPHRIVDEVRSERRPSAVNSCVSKLMRQILRPFVVLHEVSKSASQ